MDESFWIFIINIRFEFKLEIQIFYLNKNLVKYSSYKIQLILFMTNFSYISILFSLESLKMRNFQISKLFRNIKNNWFYSFDMRLLHK